MASDTNASRITMGLHTAVAIIIGYFSPIIAGMYGTNWIPGGVGIGVLIAVGFLSEKLVTKRGMKFWAANGIFIYLLIWLVSWTYFFNMV